MVVNNCIFLNLRNRTNVRNVPDLNFSVVNNLIFFEKQDNEKPRNNGACFVV